MEMRAKLVIWMSSNGFSRNFQYTSTTKLKYKIISVCVDIPGCRSDSLYVCLSDALCAFQIIHPFNSIHSRCECPQVAEYGNGREKYQGAKYMRKNYMENIAFFSFLLFILPTRRICDSSFFG